MGAAEAAASVVSQEERGGRARRREIRDALSAFFVEALWKPSELKPGTRAILRRTDDIDRELKRLISQARAGDADAALVLLQQFAAAVEDTRRDRGRQTVVRERLNLYLAQAFRKIIDGVDPWTAFALRRTRKRPLGTYTTDHPQLAAKVVERILKGDGSSSDKRYEQVAAEAGVAKNTVKAAFKQFGQLKMFEAFQWLTGAERTRLLSRVRGVTSKKSRA
jgi:hypothetical protein